MAKNTVVVSVLSDTKDLANGMAAGAKSMAGLAAAAAAAAAAVGTAAYALGKTWDAATDALIVGTGASGAALDGLKASVGNIARTVPGDFQTVADAVATLNTATGETGEGMEALTRQVLEGSRLLGEDGVSNAKAYGQALNQWQIDAAGGAAAMDGLFVVTQNYGTGLGELIGSLNTYGSVLQNVGFNMEESAVLFGALDKAGLSVSRIMPGLNKSFRDWASAGKDVQAELAATVDAIAGAETSTEALALATDTFGAEGAQRLTTAIRNGSFALDDLSGALDGSAGAIANTAAQTNSLAENWEIFSNRAIVALEPVGTAVFDMVNNLISPALDTLGGMLESVDWSALVAGDINFSEMFTGLLDAAVQGITTAANWLATGGASTIVNSIVSGRAALFDAAFSVFPAILEALIVAIPAIVEGLVSLVTSLAEMLVTQAPILLNGAVLLFTSLLDALVTILPTLLEAIIGLLPVLVGAILEMIPAILTAAISLFTALVESIPVILPLLLTAIIELLPALIETILGLIPAILDAAISLFTALVESIPVILPLLLTAIIELLPKIVASVLGMIPALLNAAVKLFVALVTAVPKIIPELLPALAALLPKIVGAIGQMIPSLVQAGIDLMGGLISGLGQMAGAVGDTILSIAQGAIDGFLSFFGINSPSRRMAGYGTNLVEGLVKGVGGSEGLVDRAMGSLSDAITGGLDAELDAGSVSVTGAGVTAAGGAAPVYNITVQALAATPEIGRQVVEAIRTYELAGGRA